MLQILNLNKENWDQLGQYDEQDPITPNDSLTQVIQREDELIDYHKTCLGGQIND